MTLREKVLAAAQAFPVPPRPAEQERTRSVATIAVAAAAAVTVLWISGGPGHAAGRPFDISLWIVGGTAVIAAAATALALPRARSMLPRSRGALLSAIAIVPVLTGLWIGSWHGVYADPFVRTGVRCFALTALTAPWPFVALVRLRRRPDPIHPALTGGGLGAAAGAWSAVMVELWCPLATPRHVALGHVAPLVLLVVAGAAIGSWLFRAPRMPARIA